MKFQLVGPALMAGALLFAACGDDDSPTSSAADTEEQLTTTTTPIDEENEADTGPAEEVTRLWIQPDLVDCQGEAPQKCMQVAESENGGYEFFYDDIEGFTFNEGTSYVIDVTVEDVEDPPADASSLAYTLVEIVSQSDNDDGATTTVTTPVDDEGKADTGPADEATRLWIGPEQVDCEGVAPQKCLQVSETEDGDAELFYDNIEGFTHKPGFAYVIDVTIENVEDPPADASSLAYTLVEIIEETEVLN